MTWGWEEALKQGGVTAVAVGAVTALGRVWVRYTGREDAHDAALAQRVKDLEAALTAAHGAHAKAVAELHLQYGEKLQKVHEASKRDLRMVAQAAVAQGDSAELLRDALTAMHDNSVTIVTEIGLLRRAFGAGASEELPLVTPRPRLRAPTVPETGRRAALQPTPPVASERTRPTLPPSPPEAEPADRAPSDSEVDPISTSQDAGDPPR